MEDKDFQSFIESSTGLVLVDFWSPSCGPCRMLTPVLEKIAENPDVTIIKVDITQCPQTSRKYKISVVPTIIFFKDGVVVHTVMGFHSEAQLSEMIGRLK